MLGSLFLIVTVSAAALLGPAVGALLRVRPGRRAHVAQAVGSTRRLQLVGAATLVGLGGLGVAWLLGAGPFLALATAALHAGSVVAWARTYPSWGVRGVVVWTLQFTATVGLLSWLVHRMATSEPSPVRLVVGGLAWLLLLVALVPAQRYLRSRIGARADRDVAEDDSPATPVAVTSPRQAAVSVAALLVASGVVVAVSSGGPVSPRDDPAQAGRSDSPDEGTRGPSVGTPSGSPSPAGPDRGTQRDDSSAGGSGEGSTDGSVQPDTAATGAPAPSGSTPSAPRAAEPQPTKTPGYEKEKPHRRDDLPSHPGGPKAP